MTLVKEFDILKELEEITHLLRNPMVDTVVTYDKRIAEMFKNIPHNKSGSAIEWFDVYEEGRGEYKIRHIVDIAQSDGYEL